MYIKQFDAHGNYTGASKLDVPVFVKWQTCNGLMVRCERDDAQGVIGSDDLPYLLGGQMPHGIPEPYAEEITEEEYKYLIDGDDPEDDDPVIPDGQDEPPMTRAELTAKIVELEATNAMLTECILEMSEIVYG